MRLLFVDDEPAILSGLKRLLFDMDENWEAQFANSGPEALACLEQQPADVIVSDMRMPGMDGVTLLEHVQELYPESIRMILSGQADEQSAIRALRVAHQFFAKPFDPSALCALIVRTEQVTRLLKDNRMRELVGSLSNLPPIPTLYRELTCALQSARTTTSDIITLVQRDPTMTAKILQLANSSFFSRRVATADLQTAVMHLGTNMIRHLVLTVELFDSCGKLTTKSTTEATAIRDKAVTMARVAEELARGTNLKTEAFTMGLLADVGQLVLALVKGDEWRACRSRAQELNRPLHELEYEQFGISHAEVGGFLLGIWGLPFSVVEAVVHHHQPQNVAAMGPAAIAAIATAVVDGSELDPVWLSQLHLTSHVETLRRQFGNPRAT